MLETSPDRPVTVKTITEAVKEYIDRLGAIWIEGELSEINERSGGMAFMRLRDSAADMSINVMCHRSVIASISPIPQNARVVIHAKPNWYTKSGTLTFAAKEMRQVGVGELLARLEALKNLLAKEGLFSADRKVALPLLQKKVVLICGRNSDAEKDVIENAKRRWPAVEFVLREVSVQGAAAVTEVSAALIELEEMAEVDVIVITRGGGSFEDLLPFSDESLVRLAANCETPIVSAIGHEKDSPLLDLVADYRASTPTDAGKRIVPDLMEEVEYIEILKSRAWRHVSNRFDRELDKVKVLNEKVHRVIRHRIEIANENIVQVMARIRALSPQSTLERGYAVVQLTDGKIARDPKELRVGDVVRLRLAKGESAATISKDLK
jgi:exodeoxyribonuclease VII large subunit